MARIGFVGLGNMGGPMARNLLKAGHQLAGYDLVPAVLEGFAAAGGTLAASAAGVPGAPRLLVGTGQDRVHLVVAVTADRGLAGAFNTNAGRAARTLIRRLEGEGKRVQILTIGRKGRDYLRREFADRIIGEFSFAG